MSDKYVFILLLSYARGKIVNIYLDERKIKESY